MNWTFHPKNKDLTTSLPLSVEVSEYVGRPVVSIDEIGTLDLKPGKDGILRADFYLTLPGHYNLKIKDAETTVLHPMEISQHTYLNFQNEFGTFFLLFIIVMGGIILWTKKIMH